MARIMPVQHGKPDAGNQIIKLLGSVVAVALAFGALAEPDGLVFDLRTAAGFDAADSSTYSNISDRMSNASAAPKVVTKVSKFTGDTSICGTPDPIVVSNMTVTPPAFNWNPYEQNCLYFPQPLWTGLIGEVQAKKCFPQAVEFPVAAQTGSNVTVFVRFRWDGNLRDSYEGAICDLTQGQRRDSENQVIDSYGFGIRMYYSSAALTEDVGSSYLRVYVGGSNHNFYDVFSKGKWIDMAVVMEYVESYMDGVPGTRVTLYHNHVEGSTYRLQRSSAGSEANYKKRHPYTPLDPHGNVASTLTIGSCTGNAGKWTAWQNSNSTCCNVFRGAIAELKIYNRAMTKAEVCAMMHAGDGAELSVGSVNGSADEFAKDGDEAAVFEPMTMTSDRLHANLTAAKPSTTVKFPIYEESERLPRVLCVTPVLDGVADGEPLAVSVNGTDLGTMQLMNGVQAELALPKRVVVRDGEGNLAITLARVGASPAGTVKLDQLRVTGSWQFGTDNGRSDDWCFRSASKISDSNIANWLINSFATVGSPYGVAFLESAYNGMKNESKTTFYYPFQQMAFYVSPSTVEMPATLKFGAKGVSENGKTELTTYLNGAKIDESYVFESAPQVRSIELPAGTLVAGVNTLVFSNSTYNYQGSKQYSAIDVDSIGLEIKPQFGMMILIR